MRTRLLVLPAAGALLVGVAAPASAVVTVTGGSVTGDGASDSFSVYCNAGVLTASTSVSTGDACATLASLYITPGGGVDTIDLNLVTAAAFPVLPVVHVDLDDGGTDTLTGSPLGDSVTGGGGDTAHGGAGNDTFNGVGSAFGGAGDDVFLEAYTYAAGGAGDDRFLQFTASAGIEGGDGVDSWEADFDQYGGATPADVVTFTMGPGDLTVTSPGSSATVPISGIEQVEMGLLRNASDTWRGQALVATQDVRGFSGNDTITGGSLADALFGGTGADTLTGGGGEDMLHGGDGNDVVQARDGVGDRVDCGAGTDTVVADASDVVTGCESVQLPPVAPPSPPAPPAPAVPDTGAISGKGKVTKPLVAKFRFSSSSAGATFQCKVDKGSWKSCTSPYKVATRKLSYGKHTLRVRAVLAGKKDPTPSVRTFRVVR